MIQVANRNIPRMFQITPCVISVLFWEFHENPVNRFSAMLLGGMDSSGKVEKISCVQGVEWNILKMFPIVLCIKSHLPWKFHENPFSRFSIMLLTDRQTDRQTDERAIGDCALAKIWRFVCETETNFWYPVQFHTFWAFDRFSSSNIDRAIAVQSFDLFVILMTSSVM